MPAGETASATVVAEDCAAEIVRVSVALAPSVTVEIGGTSDTTVGSNGVTVTWLTALVPLRLAVMSLVPGEIAPMAIGALTCPASTVTEGGADAIPALA